MTEKICRFCQASLTTTFVDLGMYPLSNSYLSAEETNQMARYYPLHVFVCDQCLLVQIQAFETPEFIFTNYLYTSSYSESWLKHCERYTEMICQRLALGRSSLVVEVASNDGYLLKYFKEREVPALGIEPAANVAKLAVDKGILTLVEFFGTKCADHLARQGKQADLLIGNNVFAHVPDVHDFTAGLKRLLKDTGVITLEFPHVMQLVMQNQFDTIYQEHFSYYSFLAAEKILESHRLSVFDVEELPTHGGSLRLYARHYEDRSKPALPSVAALRAKESAAGMDKLAFYLRFNNQVQETKRKLLAFLIA
jgi:SAM-dependent methyltransferase